MKTIVLGTSRNGTIHEAFGNKAGCNQRLVVRGVWAVETSKVHWDGICARCFPTARIEHLTK